MFVSRTEKYRDYRHSIANSTDKIPTLTMAKSNEINATETGYFKKIILKRRIETSIILLIIVAIITLLVIFGIKLF